ncbi:MAG: SMP-30/gluconolactonase/LRE family protein [Bacteroidota bacterium]
MLANLSCSKSPSLPSADAQPSFSGISASVFTSVGEFTNGIEGPAVDKEGNIYAVNFANKGTIGKVSPAGESSLFATLPEGSTGNGIRLDKNGTLYIADYTGHKVLKLDPITREITIHAHDSSMNQPNDLAIRSDGTLFASDPNWKESTGNLWRIDTDGSTHLLESDMGTTNGVELNPDESQLYVNESISRKVWVYDLSKEGEISNKRLLIEFPDHGMDGMRCDSEGNLYITRHGKGTVAIVSSAGSLLHEVSLTGAKPSNIAFGGPEGKTCYITLQDKGNIETFQALYPGRGWSLIHQNP